MIKKAGIQRRIYTAGKNKSTLDPFVEEKQEDIERLKKIQLDLHSDFIKVVEDSRSSKLKKDKNLDLFTGEFWSGSKAKELGLIDGLGNADEILKEKFGEDVTIKKFEKPKSWLNKKLSGVSENQIEDNMSSTSINVPSSKAVSANSATAPFYPNLNSELIRIFATTGEIIVILIGLSFII